MMAHRPAARFQYARLWALGLPIGSAEGGIDHGARVFCKQSRRRRQCGPPQYVLAIAAITGGSVRAVDDRNGFAESGGLEFLLYASWLGGDVALAEFPDARSGLEAGSRTFRVGIERSPIVRLATLLERERGRWFLWAPVLYGAGVAVYFGLATEPSIAAALVPLITALVLRVVFSRGTLTVVATGAAVGMALGFAAAKLRTEWVRAPVLERQLSGAAVRGWVELVEPRSGRGERITIRVHAISGISQERMPHRVRVTTSRAVPGLGPGVPVRLKATLSPPPIPALPGGYDFARTAYFMRLGGVGYALSAPTIDDQAAPAPLLLRASAAAARIRQAISHRVRAGLEGEQGAIADALITGERGGISDSTNAAYRGAGIFHILSISGLHMTIMAGAVFFAVRFLLAGIPAIALRYPIKKWAAVAATLAALGYLLISGGAFATVRSWLMITVMFLAVVMDRPAVTLRNVAVSALAILLVLPESLLDIGFQMSFAAVVALVASYEAIRTRVPGGQGGRPFGRVLVPLLFFGGIILSTVVASIAVAPFAVYHFHNSQQYAVIANLIAIPVCNIVVMP
ncbi:MAG: ComEC/Rec2 family competence protein, partial [Hyphomicrobiaceae bacterium]